MITEISTVSSLLANDPPSVSPRRQKPSSLQFLLLNLISIQHHQLHTRKVSVLLSEVLVSLFHRFVTLTLFPSNTLNLDTCSKHAYSKSNTLNCLLVKSSPREKEKWAKSQAYARAYENIKYSPKPDRLFLGLCNTLSCFCDVKQTNDEFPEIIYHPLLNKLEFSA